MSDHHQHQRAALRETGRQQSWKGPPEPQPKRPKRAPKRESVRPKPAAESAFADEKPQSPQATPVATRQLRTRKTSEAVKEDPRTPSPKKNKTIAIDAPSKFKAKSSTVPIKSSTTPRRSTRTRIKTKKQTLLDADSIEASTEMNSRVIILKTSPSWFSPGGALERMTTSQRAKSSTPETSFASMSDRPAVFDGEQYAQPAWAPVPASSHTTSTDGSSFLRAEPLHHSQRFVPQEHSTVTSQGTLPTSPYNHNREVSHMGRLSGLIDGTQPQKRAMVEEAETQPTQLLSQPYSKSSQFKPLITPC